MMTEEHLLKEKQEILNAYRGLLRACRNSRSDINTRMIRKAFNIAMDAHKDDRRKSGEPYIFHPIAVARIVAEEIGLGTTSIVCALLHDTVEDTEITLDDIERMFNKKVRKIIDGLTKIPSTFQETDSIQAENFRKMLLTLSDDVRVILIKIADRLHNMRTLGSMKRESQLKIASETLFLYAPLAHRLGLYSIKTELEDLSLKYTRPEEYQEIENKLEKTREVRNRFIRSFCHPIRRTMQEEGYQFDIKARTKSIFSIWNKIHKKDIPFEEIYDLFAIRIILDVPQEQEKSACWRVYSIVTDFYRPNPDRLRDWISTPRANGYESLHTTVMSPTGKWVEVQIRTGRMDEIAEKGYAAHWKYKENKNDESKLDAWLGQIRELLEQADGSAVDFIDDFKLNLFSDEIYVFTPKGELKTLPLGSTALDFAFDIHSHIGEHCIGAKVNNKLVPLSHKLRSGDQIEILTSKKQSPKEDWLQFVTTAKAKGKIKNALKEEHRKIASEGKEILQRKFRNRDIQFNSDNVQELVKYYRLHEATELYFRIAKGSIDLGALKEFAVVHGNLSRQIDLPPSKDQEHSDFTTHVGGKTDTIIIGNDLQQVEYTLAKCCNPIPGDDIFAFITVSEGVKIHRSNCPNATQLMSKYAYRAVKARWRSQALNEYLIGIRFTGIDDIGIVKGVTDVVSGDMQVNMRSISFESHAGTFEGKIMVYVYDTEHLSKLINNLAKVSGVITVERMETDEHQNH
jgi:GTP pyrophosphokinase